MGFQIKIFPILRVFWSISFGKVLCSSAKVLQRKTHKMLLLEKTIFHKY